MAVIYLKHPEHGKKVAIMSSEADADKKNGWVEFDPEAEKKPVVVAEESMAEPVQNVVSEPAEENVVIVDNLLASEPEVTENVGKEPKRRGRKKAK